MLIMTQDEKEGYDSPPIGSISSQNRTVQKCKIVTLLKHRYSGIPLVYVDISRNGRLIISQAEELAAP